jgi:hypothetical protein
MKFKQLLSKIESLQENAPEATFGGGLYIGDVGRGDQSALTNKGTFNLKLPHSIDAINALLSGFSMKDYIDPSSVIGVVKQKLNHFGLDFDHKNMEHSEGDNIHFKLFQYGSPQIGVYGQNPYDDVNKKGFKQGDGITEKLGHGLDLVASITKSPNGLRRLQLTIVPSISLDSESDCGCMH